MNTQPLDRRLDETCDRLSREIREHPLLCVGLAFGAGMLLGAIGGRSVGHSSSPGWLAGLASDISDRAHDASDRAAKAGHRASREVRSAAHRVADAAGDVDFDKLVSRGRHWLRAILS